MFCKYCGKMLQEGESCGCQSKSLADSAEKGLEQVNFKNVMLQAKNIIVQFIKTPVNTLEEAYGSKKKEAQFAIGAVYLTMVLLCSLIALSQIVEFEKAFTACVGIVLALLVVKLFFAGIMFLAARKNDGNFKDILAEVCVSTIPQTVCILAAFVLALFGGMAGAVLVLLIAGVIDIITGCVTAGVVFKYNRNLGYWVFVANQTVLILLSYLVAKNIIVSALNRAMDSLSF